MVWRPQDWAIFHTTGTNHCVLSCIVVINICFHSPFVLLFVITVYVLFVAVFFLIYVGSINATNFFENKTIVLIIILYLQLFN